MCVCVCVCVCCVFIVLNLQCISPSKITNTKLIPIFTVHTTLFSFACVCVWMCIWLYVCVCLVVHMCVCVHFI